MLSLQRVVSVPRLDAARGVHFLLHRELRAYVVRAHGVTVDKRLFVDTRLAHSPGPRHLVQIVVSGRMRLATAGRAVWLEAGDVSLQRHGLPDERWEGAPFAAVVLEWTPAWGRADVATWTTGRVDNRTRARLVRWAAAVPALGRECAPAHVAELLGLLAAEGIPVWRHEPGALVEPVPAATHAIAAALGASLSNLGDRPRMIDLETALGRSPRHLRRELTGFGRYYDFPGGPSWHRLLHWWRLAMATTLMTARGATTELVAAAVGYGSPRSFCLAMAQAQLPSPGRIAAAVAQLR